MPVLDPINHNDLFYKDFFIPRCSNIAVCAYVPHYDERRIESPNEFRPERYLNHTLKSAAYANQGDPNLRDHFSFGHGRRICSGIHVARLDPMSPTALCKSLC